MGKYEALSAASVFAAFVMASASLLMLVLALDRFFGEVSLAVLVLVLVWLVTLLDP